MLNKERECVFLIDATGFVLKYWFVMPKIVTKNYESISAFLGFCSFIINFLSKEKPKYLMCAFDESLGTCFRNEIYNNYKKHREHAPDELKTQFKLCKKFLKLIGINNLSSNKYEADDIINTVSINMKRENFNNVIITNDKDLYQTIYKNDIWWDFNKKKFTYNDLYKKLSFCPQYVPDLLGLMGDAADNIPGAPGIGEKTATVLINKYNNLETIFKNIEEIPRSLGSKYKRYVKIMIDNKEKIFLSRKLANLAYMQDIKKNRDCVKREKVNIKKLNNFLLETGMKVSQTNSWINQISKLCEVI